MRNKAVASLLVVVVLVSVGAGYLIGTTSQHTQTTTATEFTQTTVYTLGSPLITTTNSISISSVGSETFVTFLITLTACTSCNNTVGGATFTYPLSINYGGGPWGLHYWVENFSGTQNSINGNLVGSGNSDTWITFYVAGYAQYTLCASATKFPNDSPQLFDIPLTLSLFDQNESATESNSTVEVCGTMAV